MIRIQTMESVKSVEIQLAKQLESLDMRESNEVRLCQNQVRRVYVDNGSDESNPLKKRQMTLPYACGMKIVGKDEKRCITCMIAHNIFLPYMGSYSGSEESEIFSRRIISRDNEMLIMATNIPLILMCTSDLDYSPIGVYLGGFESYDSFTIYPLSSGHILSLINMRIISCPDEVWTENKRICKENEGSNSSEIRKRVNKGSVEIDI